MPIGYRVLRSDACQGQQGKKHKLRKRGDVIPMSEASKIPARRLKEYIDAGILMELHEDKSFDEVIK